VRAAGKSSFILSAETTRRRAMRVLILLLFSWTVKTVRKKNLVCDRDDNVRRMSRGRAPPPPEDVYARKWKQKKTKKKKRWKKSDRVRNVRKSVESNGARRQKPVNQHITTTFRDDRLCSRRTSRRQVCEKTIVDEFGLIFFFFFFFFFSFRVFPPVADNDSIPRLLPCA